MWFVAVIANRQTKQISMSNDKLKEETRVGFFLAWDGVTISRYSRNIKLGRLIHTCRNVVAASRSMLLLLVQQCLSGCRWRGKKRAHTFPNEASNSSETEAIAIHAPPMLDFNQYENHAGVFAGSAVCMDPLLFVAIKCSLIQGWQCSPMAPNQSGS